MKIGKLKPFYWRKHNTRTKLQNANKHDMLIGGKRKEAFRTGVYYDQVYINGNLKNTNNAKLLVENLKLIKNYFIGQIDERTKDKPFTGGIKQEVILGAQLRYDITSKYVEEHSK